MKSDYIKASLYNSLYKYMQYDNVLVMRLCLETGLRVGDAVKVRRSDIKGNTLTFVAEKTGKPGKKVLSSKLVKELRRNCNSRSDDSYCFPGRLGGHRTRQTVWADIKKACKQAGLKENVTPHSARKTYAVNIFHENGIEKAEQELQHDNLNTTMLYAFSDLLTKAGTTNCVDNGIQNTTYCVVKAAVLDALKEFFENSDLTFSRLSTDNVSRETKK